MNERQEALRGLVPAGFTIERVEERLAVQFLIREGAVDLYPLNVSVRKGRVYWPMTTDNRPVVAEALAIAMLMAAEEARS